MQGIILPPEILTHTFRLGCESQWPAPAEQYRYWGGIGIKYSHHLKSFAGVLTGVCSSWSRLVDDDPNLWVSEVLICSPTDQIAAAAKLARVGLEAHPFCDIAIFIGRNYTKTFGEEAVTLVEEAVTLVEDLVTLVKDFASRIRFLSVNSGPIFAQHTTTLIMTDPRFNRLETFEILSYNASLTIDPCVMPRLTNLYLTLSDVAWGGAKSVTYSSTSNVSVLELTLNSESVTLGSLLSILETMPFLESLELSICGLIETYGVKAISLPRLKNLMFTTNLKTAQTALEHIHTPNLEQLRFASYCDSACCTGAAKTVSLPALKSISFEAFAPAVAEILSGISMPNLTSLVATEPDPWHTYLSPWLGDLSFPIVAPSLNRLEVRAPVHATRGLFRCFEDHPPQRLKTLIVIRYGEAPFFLPNIPMPIFNSVETLHLEIHGCSVEDLTQFYSQFTSLKHLKLYFGSPGARSAIPRFSRVTRGTKRHPQLEMLESVALYKVSDSNASPLLTAPKPLTTKELSFVQGLAEVLKVEGRPLKLLTCDAPVADNIRMKLETLVEQLQIIQHRAIDTGTEAD